MKRVVFYNGSLRMGGIERVMVEVLQNLDLSKYKITLLIEAEIKKENVFEKDIPKEIEIKYLISEETISKTKKYRENRKKSMIDRLMYNFMMWQEHLEKEKNIKKLSEERYDTVIDFDMGLSKNIDMINANKKIAWVHASIKNWYEKPGRIKRLGERLKKYDRVVTICEDMKKETESLYPFLKENLVTIYNPFNFHRIISLSKESVEKSLEPLLKDKYLVSVMRLTNHQKDFPTLIEGFEKAKETGIKEKLYILGDGPDRASIEEMIVKKGMKSEIILLGSQKNPYPWISNAELFLHSSKYEGLPTVLIEALILDKVVISSDCPTGPREILKGGESGILYPIGDNEKLSKEIVSLLKDKNKREKYMKNGKERAKEFSTEKVMKRYEEIIEGINIRSQSEL